MATWLTPDDPALLELWTDAPEDDATLALYLSAAKEACIAYAPELPTPTYNPVTFTWPDGSTADLSRDGDVITANVKIVAALASGHNAKFTLPEGFGLPGDSWLTFPGYHGTVYGRTAASFPGTISLGGSILEFSASWAAEPATGDGIPDSWRLAQAMQARNLYNAGLASPSGDLDGGSYGLSTFPLDWQVQQLLRPRRGMGAIL